MDRLRFLAHRLNADIRTDRPLLNHAALTRRPGAWVLSISSRTPPERRAPVAACLLNVAALDWVGYQFLLRFPIPGDSRAVRDAKTWERKGYRIPYRAGLRLLIPDEAIAGWVREETDPRLAAYEAGVGIDDLAWRFGDWEASRAPRATPPDMAALIASGLLKPASAVTPGKRPPPRPRQPTPNRHAVARARAMADYDGPITF